MQTERAKRAKKMQAWKTTNQEYKLTRTMARAIQVGVKTQVPTTRVEPLRAKIVASIKERVVKTKVVGGKKQKNQSKKNLYDHGKSPNPVCGGYDCPATTFEARSPEIVTAKLRTAKKSRVQNFRCHMPAVSHLRRPQP